jgi:hypothetical protein
MTAAEMRNATIRAQLAREFADRLDIEADAWAAVATAKREAASAYRAQADKFTIAANIFRKAAKSRAKESTP